MQTKAVFLDRDGTINVDKGYVYKIEDFEFINDAIQAIRLLNKSNFKVIVITNQSGVARGYYTEEDVERLHRFINKKLSAHNAHIDAFYYCPHHKDGKVKKYKIDCECRKPKGGLLRQAIRDFNIDVRNSFLIGDKLSDIKMGNKIGCQTILVKTGPGVENTDNCYPRHTLNSIYEAAELILSLQKEKNLSRTKV